MARFSETSVACLKRTMLACSPRDFRFNAYDVEVIMKETGLNQAQVQVWADHFRMRYETQKDRMDFLQADGFDKENTVKMSRYFVSCFNVTPEFASEFKFPKSRGGGEFGIKYMEAAFNKEAGSGEFFFEFEDYVWSNKLVELFYSKGAGQVSTITFANVDGGESASNALLRIISSQEKTGIAYTRGTCPSTLLNRVQAKKAAAAQMSSGEFEEKTVAAIKHSMEEQAAILVKVEGGLQSQVVKLDGIQEGVCNVIPDYQNKIAKLEEALAYQIVQRNSQEGKTSAQTRVVNQQKDVITAKDIEIATLHKREDFLLKRIQELESNLDMCKAVEHLKQMTQLAQEERVFARSERVEFKQAILEVRENTETLSSLVSQEQERATKRQRI